MAKKDHGDGPAAFEDFYGTQHGPRWPELRQACARPNPHFSLETGLLKAYFLDPASVFAALQLEIHPGLSVLDLCAAPGGKSLVIAQRLFGLTKPNPSLADLGCIAGPGVSGSDHAANIDQMATQIPKPPVHEFSATETDADSRLVANERSATRRGRLRSVLAEHIPARFQEQITVTGHDAATWGQHQNQNYDRILLDIPCSSERHLIQDPRYLRDWSINRTKQLAQQAYTMGLSAGRALKIGGSLLYCTCALSNLENDQAVERIINRSLEQAQRFGYSLKAESYDPRQPSPPSMKVEATKWGAQIWPDRSADCGPLYFARIKKVAP